MDDKCKNYVRACFEKAEFIYKCLYHIVFLEICESFNLMPKGLEAKKIYFCGGDVWKLREEMGCEFD